jgi:hypothetical protein
MTNVIVLAGGRPEFWIGLLLAAGLGALAWIAGLVAVPEVIRLLGGG